MVLHKVTGCLMQRPYHRDGDQKNGGFPLLRLPRISWVNHFISKDYVFPHKIGRLSETSSQVPSNSKPRPFCRAQRRPQKEWALRKQRWLSMPKLGMYWQQKGGIWKTHMRKNSIPGRYDHLSQLLTWQSRNGLGNGNLNIPKEKYLCHIIMCGLRCTDKQFPKLKDVMYQQPMLYLLAFKGQLNHYHTTMTASTQDRSKSLLNKMVISI